MNENEAVEQLATIRRIMESATQMTTLPGKAAVCGGVLALIGCGVSCWKMRSLDFAEMANLLPRGLPRAGRDVGADRRRRDRDQHPPDAPPGPQARRERVVAAGATGRLCDGPGAASRRPP